MSTTTPRKTKPVLTDIKPRYGSKRAWACTLRAAGVVKKRLKELGGTEFVSSLISCQLAIVFNLPNGLGRLQFEIIEQPQFASGTLTMFGRFLDASKAQLEALAAKGLIPGCNPISGKWNHYFQATQHEVDMLLDRMTIWLPQITGIERPESFEEPQF